jgi:hypothetical protein
MLTQFERERIKQFAAAAEERVRPKSDESVIIVQDTFIPQLERSPTATVLHFPKVHVVRRRLPIRKTRMETERASLPLFDYADTVHRSSSEPLTSRSDQWFADFGWRG